MDKRKPVIAIVVPCYNEEEALPLFYAEIVKVAKRLPEADHASLPQTMSYLSG